VTDAGIQANLEELTDQLESAAAQLRDGALEIDAASELDRLARAGGERPGQDRLL